MHTRVCLARVPVLVYHSVRRDRVTELGDLSLEESVFERQIGELARAGYRAITCAKLADHLEHGAVLPARPVLVTFDDGYLDNHTIAGPILRRHGFKAVVFVATQSIDPRALARPTSDDAAHPDESGFLTAAELVAMEASGVFEIQGHSAAHERLPIAPEVVDFHRPDAPCAWLAAQRRTALAWGTPVLRSAWMGEARAFLPEPALEERVTAHVRSHGGASFFAREDWRAELERVVARAPIGGRFESDDERRARLALDLGESRRTLESILGHPVQFMAWPGGGSSPLAIEVALDEAGFRATFGTNRLPPGVVADRRAIPRTYFNQTYRGGFATLARVWKLRGVVDFESGRSTGYARLFVANRLMQLFGGTGRRASSSHAARDIR